MLKNSTNSKRGNQGFTIIEVLIVLAIAGLILLIVFLAVPALQRNARNTQRQNDIAAIGGALAEFVNNNNGALPTNDAGFDTGVKPNYKLGYYDDTIPTTIVYTKNAAAVAPAIPTSADQVRIHSNTKCAATSPVTTTTVGASSRGLVALYSVESGGNTVPQCKEL